jgi:hypothetical protein
MQARIRLILLGFGLLLGSLVSACGTSNIGAGGPSLGVAQNQRAVGVVAGGFEVIRQNQRGYNDSALNSTLSLDIKDQANEKALVIGVRDSNFTSTVAIEVIYDEAKYHPVRAEFSDLLGSPSQTLTAAFLDAMPGVAGIGATALHDYTPPALNGQFVTVVFAPGPDRAVSNVAGDAHENPLGVADVLTNVGLDNLVVDPQPALPAVPNEVTVIWTSAWMIGNGDGNKEVNVSDLQPIGTVFKQTTGTSFGAIKGDYDRNTEANASDLQRIGVFFKRFTDAYLVEAADDDGSSPETVATLDGATDQLPPNLPPDAAALPAPLTTVFPYWQVVFNAGSAFTIDQLRAKDVNADGNIQLTITPLGTAGAANGVPASKVITVGSPVPPINQLVITDFNVTVDDGAGNDLLTMDSTNDELTAAANTLLGFRLESIDGTFNGVAFTGRPATDPGPSDQLHQADYDTAFAAAQGFLIWDFSTGGDALARRSSEWLTFAAGSSPFLGTLAGPGTIFPDWDPESVLPTSPEGNLSITLPIEGGALPGGGTATYPSDAVLKVQVVGAPVVLNLRFDVDVDPAQPTLPEYKDKNGIKLLQLIANRENIIQGITLDWGSGGVPADLSTVELELVRIGASGLITGPPITFTYQPVMPAAPGEFTIFEKPDGSGGFAYDYSANLNGSLLTQGANYVMRMKANGVWSTLNLPPDMISVAPPPPPQPMITVPSQVADSHDNLQLFYSDTTLHRNGAMVGFNPPPPTPPTFTPEDQAAFDDILRIDGNEFVPNWDISGPQAQAYPVVVVKDAAGGAITGENDPGAVVGINLIERGANRIVLDVAAITFGGAPGNPVTYNYMVFDKGGIELGQGSFTYDAGFGFPTTPQSLKWGVNVFNRESKTPDPANYDILGHPNIRTLDADAVWSGKDINNNPIPSATPPVLFFEFFGGSPFDYNQNEEGQVFSPMNPFVMATTDPTGVNRIMNMSIALRLAGVAPNGAYIFIHTVTPGDFDQPGAPGWTGVFSPGNGYDLGLIDPQTDPSSPFQPTPDTTRIFTMQGQVSDPNYGQMVVIGTNPWS